MTHKRRTVGEWYAQKHNEYGFSVRATGKQRQPLVRGETDLDCFVAHRLSSMEDAVLMAGAPRLAAALRSMIEDDKRSGRPDHYSRTRPYRDLLIEVGEPMEDEEGQTIIEVLARSALTRTHALSVVITADEQRMLLNEMASGGILSFATRGGRRLWLMNGARIKPSAPNGLLQKGLIKRDPAHGNGSVTGQFVVTMKGAQVIGEKEL